MKKIILILIILLIILFSINYIKTSDNPEVTIGNYIFEVAIAKTDQEKATGLSSYYYLPVNHGMLFPFSTSDTYAFWMKDMKFPIDIIYIQQNKIVDIFDNVPPPKSSTEQLPIYKPSKIANYVLEINAGLSKKYNFKTGAFVKINL